MTADRVLKQLVDELLGIISRELRRYGSAMETLDDRKQELLALRKALHSAGRSFVVAVPRKRSATSISKRGAITFPIVALRFSALQDGGAIVTVVKKELGSSKPIERTFTLTGTLARTLAMLANQPTTGSDGFPETMKVEELAVLLSTKEDKLVKRGAASERITRLREAFSNAGLNRFLIERTSSSARVLWLRVDRS